MPEKKMNVQSYLVGALLCDDLTPEQEQDKLNLCGEQGWVLVSANIREAHGRKYMFYYFRREVPETDARFNPADLFESFL